MDVYLANEYKTPLNGRNNGNGLLYVRPPQNDPNYFHNIYHMCPTRAGMHLYDQTTRTMSLTVKGPAPIEIRQTEVAMLEVGVEMVSETNFFDEDLIVRLSQALGIPLSNIRIVQAVSENDRRRRRRSIVNTIITDATGSEELTYLSVEIGENPAPRREPDVFTVSTENEVTLSSDTETGMSTLLIDWS